MNLYKTYESTALDVVDVFSQFRMAPTPNDQFQAIGRDVLISKVNNFVSKNQPIDFVMLGYPMKSPNHRDKTLGELPDLAESLSFKQMGRFSELVKAVYNPGIKIQMASDGYVFSDLLGVEDRIVAEYQERNEDWTRNLPIEWHNLYSFYKNDARTRVIKDFGIDAVELERRILLDPDVNYLYRGMIKFLTLDLAVNDYPSNTQLQKDAKRVAREMMFRNEAFSKLVANEFNNSIRLSMHPSVNNGNKFSFQLINSPKAWTSPWHCAIALVDGIAETIHRRDAAALGYELVYENGQPFNFVKI